MQLFLFEIYFYVNLKVTGIFQTGGWVGMEGLYNVGIFRSYSSCSCLPSEKHIQRENE